jgi:hypothetical protein
MQRDLGELICDENPYPNLVGTWDGVKNAKLGSMDIYFGKPHLIQNIQWEGWDSNYDYKWQFDTDQHKIRKALRINVRYPVEDSSGQPVMGPHGPLYYDDVVLVGFAGSGGS